MNSGSSSCAKLVERLAIDQHARLDDISRQEDSLRRLAVTLRDVGEVLRNDRTYEHARFPRLVPGRHQGRDEAVRRMGVLVERDDRGRSGLERGA